VHKWEGTLNQTHLEKQPVDQTIVAQNEHQRIRPDNVTGEELNDEDQGERQPDPVSRARHQIGHRIPQEKSQESPITGYFKGSPEINEVSGVTKESEILIQTDPLSSQPFRSKAQDSDGKKTGTE